MLWGPASRSRTRPPVKAYGISTARFFPIVSFGSVLRLVRKSNMEEGCRDQDRKGVAEAVMSLMDLKRRFPDGAAAEEWIAACRWSGEPCCPHCGETDVQVGATHPSQPYKVSRDHGAWPPRTYNLRSTVRFRSPAGICGGTSGTHGA